MSGRKSSSPKPAQQNNAKIAGDAAPSRKGAQALAAQPSQDKLLDESLAETFPASDPIAPAAPVKGKSKGAEKGSEKDARKGAGKGVSDGASASSTVPPVKAAGSDAQSGSAPDAASDMPVAPSKSDPVEEIQEDTTRLVERENDEGATHEERVRRVAYFLAEARGFEPGHEHEDWAAAEAKVASGG